MGAAIARRLSQPVADSRNRRPRVFVRGSFSPAVGRHEASMRACQPAIIDGAADTCTTLANSQEDFEGVTYLEKLMMAGILGVVSVLLLLQLL